jgi:hypothetical protein
LFFFNGPDWHKLSARRQIESVKGAFRAETAEILKSSLCVLCDLCANKKQTEADQIASPLSR